MTEFQQALAKAATEYNLELTTEQLTQFDQYYNLVVEWNTKINLTAITTPSEFAIKHIIDSLSAFNPEYFHPGIKLIDIGTGAGFPGIPLKIYYPQIQLTLLDSLNKRIKFLDNVVSTLGLTDVKLIHGRTEEIAKNKLHREQYDIATARAVARLPILLEYCIGYLKVGGIFISMKGRQYEEEISESTKALEVLHSKIIDVHPVKLPQLEDKRAVIYIQKLQTTSKAYPRKAGTPERNPLL